MWCLVCLQAGVSSTASIGICPFFYPTTTSALIVFSLYVLFGCTPLPPPGPPLAQGARKDPKRPRLPLSAVTGAKGGEATSCRGCTSPCHRAASHSARARLSREACAGRRAVGLEGGGLYAQSRGTTKSHSHQETGSPRVTLPWANRKWKVALGVERKNGMTIG